MRWAWRRPSAWSCWCAFQVPPVSTAWKSMLKHVGSLNPPHAFRHLRCVFTANVDCQTDPNSVNPRSCVCVYSPGEKRVCQCWCSPVIILDVVQKPTFTAILVASMMKSLAWHAMAIGQTGSKPFYSSFKTSQNCGPNCCWDVNDVKKKTFGNRSVV